MEAMQTAVSEQLITRLPGAMLGFVLTLSLRPLVAHRRRHL